MFQLGFYAFCVPVAHMENSRLLGERKSVSVWVAGIFMA